MPRSARLDAPGTLHHVIGGGFEKRNIFLDDRDELDFIHPLGELAKGKAMEIYAWVLLPNHFSSLRRMKKRKSRTPPGRFLCRSGRMVAGAERRLPANPFTDAKSPSVPLGCFFKRRPNLF